MGDAPELEHVRSCAPAIAGRADEIEKARNLPPDIVDLLGRETFMAAVPECYGGTERSPRQLVEIIEELARADGSAGWCAMIWIVSALFAGHLPAEWAQHIYGRGPVLTGGATAPTGRGKRVNNGVEVTGRWQWGSGTTYCDWIAGGTVVADGRESPRRPGGEPEVYVMMFAADQVYLHDNWDPVGLAGTGSNDFEVAGAFVPDGRWAFLGDTPAIDSPITRFPFFGLFAAGVAAVPLGIARRALDEFHTLAPTKTPAWRSRPISERAVVQAATALAHARVDACWTTLRAALEDTWDTVIGGGEPSREQRIRLRRAAVHATHEAVAVVDSLYLHAGGSSIHRSGSLQRCLRDVHVTTQHMMVNPSTFEQVGALQLTDAEPNSLF